MDQRIWVTAYAVPGRRDILVTQPSNTPQALMFAFDERGIAYPVNEEALHSYRASGAVPTFYAMANPF